MLTRKELLIAVAVGAVFGIVAVPVGKLLETVGVDAFDGIGPWVFGFMAGFISFITGAVINWRRARQSKSGEH
ncbi:MAG: hypothetical protein ACLFV8_11025 [Alphaproteobacteria bacterium]